VIELPELAEREGFFRDRSDAGRVLAEMLDEEFFSGSGGIVLGIPSGGVPVGLEIARRLGLDFDVIVSRKIPYPGESEAGFGAVSAEGDVIVDEQVRRILCLSPEELDRLIRPVREEVLRREGLYRKGKPALNLTGRPVIIADDGLATGYTALACLAQARRKKPSKLVLAVPTASKRSIEKVSGAADEIYCANVRSGRWFAVASAYQSWRDLTTEEALAMLGLRKEGG
jgi:predicted phosphoribosyltransferase